MSDLSHAIKADKSGVLAELVALIKSVLWAHLFGHSPSERQALVDHPAFAALEPEADAPVAPAVPAVPQAADGGIDYDKLAAAMARRDNANQLS